MKTEVEIVLLFSSYDQLELLPAVPHASTIHKDALIGCQVGDVLQLGPATLRAVRREWLLGPGATLRVFAELVPSGNAKARYADKMRVHSGG
ncbi:hypothetical protein QTH91_18850 [Variovorax dokdonensis]|uniref:Uncharacterized protein n=1 Tax=Variovorax dokdonensis TaxID=344883 RepID=A0ABT7NF35_9BURK|nr:hypothetical protein [Variovorax dokdonensis]MDM0046556.1 hypothetical protein [Variovorax dokdonensis]